MKDRESLNKLLVILLITEMILAGCQGLEPWFRFEESAAISLPGFTYSTSVGAIWQIDIDGHRVQILPDDNVQKWYLSWSPSRQRLAYLAREIAQIAVRTTDSFTMTIKGIEVTIPAGGPVTAVNQTLIVVNADGSERKQLAGPARAIQYEWGNSDHTIGLRLAQQIANENTPQQWDLFWVDVETRATTLAAPESWGTLEPGVRPADNQDLFVSMIGLAEDELTNKQVSDFKIRAPRWSPTGEWIVFALDSAARANQPCLIHVPDSKLQCFDISAKSDQFVWSADGSYLAFLAPAGNEPIDIYIVNAVTAEMTNLTRDGNDVIEEWIAP